MSFSGLTGDISSAFANLKAVQSLYVRVGSEFFICQQLIFIATS